VAGAPFVKLVPSKTPKSLAGNIGLTRLSWRYGRGRHAANLNFGDCCLAPIKWIERLARKIASAGADIVVLECARAFAQAEFDLAQVRRVKAAAMPRVMTLIGFETPGASRPPGPLKAGEAGRLRPPDRPTTQPDGTADAIQMALSGLIRLDRYERHAATRRARFLHIFMDRKRDNTI
jgi:hypothetical protein